MNFVFLDIDGVLNNLGSAVALGSMSEYFDPVSVALVDRLCREGNAQIVISSSWRNGDTDRLRDDFRRCGADCLADRIVDETPYLSRPRGEEIESWLKANGSGAYRYVIIDDDADMLPHQPFVKTDFDDGFRFRHYQEALRKLNPEHHDCHSIVPLTTASQKDR